MTPHSPNLLERAAKPLTSREFNALIGDAADLDQKKQLLALVRPRADAALRRLLKPGDRLRATQAQCGAREANFVFSRWDGGWLLSAGGASIAPASVFKVNDAVQRF